MVQRSGLKFHSADIQFKLSRFYRKSAEFDDSTLLAMLPLIYRSGLTQSVLSEAQSGKHAGFISRAKQLLNPGGYKSDQSPAP